LFGFFLFYFALLHTCLLDIDDWSHEIEQMKKFDATKSSTAKVKDFKLPLIDLHHAKISYLASATNSSNSQLISSLDTSTAQSTFEASLDAMQDTEIKMQVAQMSFNPATLKDQLTKCNLEELYKNSTTKSRHNPLGMIVDPVYLKPTGPVEKWTYQLLVESKPISNFINLVLRDLQTLYEKLHNISSAQHEFEWSIMVDK
jgi:hypothetical protein